MTFCAGVNLLESDEMIIGVSAGKPCAASVVSGRACTSRYASCAWLPPSGWFVVNFVAVGLLSSCARAWIPSPTNEAPLVTV